MKPTCMIKSHPQGISLVMDAECDFVTLVEDVCKLFAKSREFFGAGELILAIEGRNLSPEETLVIIEAVELNTDVKIPLLLEEGELKDVRMNGLLDRFYFDRMDLNAKIIKKNVCTGEVVTSDTGLVIIGDVKKGGSVVAVGNIIVVGSLEGDARAGETDNTDAFICAGIMGQGNVSIGGISGTVDVKYRRILGRKTKSEPVIVRAMRGNLIAEPLSSGLIIQGENR